MQAAKKRTRLNLSHMSLEEKVKRRKMKNREAAQLARDRKKAKMTDLETAMAAFAEERLKLAAENASIKKQLQRLQQENEELRQRLATSVTGEQVTGPIESAELISASQPQTQGQEASLWMMPFVCLLAVIASLTTSSRGCRSAHKDCWNSRSLLQQISLEYQKEMRSLGIPIDDLTSLSSRWQAFGT